MTKEEKEKKANEIFEEWKKPVDKIEYKQPMISYCLRVISIAVVFIAAAFDVDTDILRVFAYSAIACWIIAAIINMNKRAEVNKYNQDQIDAHKALWDELVVIQSTKCDDE